MELYDLDDGSVLLSLDVGDVGVQNVEYGAQCDLHGSLHWAMYGVESHDETRIDDVLICVGAVVEHMSK